MRTLSFVLATVLAVERASAFGMGGIRSFSRSEAELVNAAKQRVLESTLDPKEYFYDAEIDHFDNSGSGSPTYKMRYLVDQTFWDKENGPIIFYAGNEGDVYSFFDNTGFMTTTLAETFGALVVYAEHRYFGESMPFGDASFDKENLKYLTVEQTMEDYVHFIRDFKTEWDVVDQAVIVGGGSYGGMLAAWLRLDYPQWFQGALAASAPILAFEGNGYDPYAYYDLCTDDFRRYDEQCPEMIKAGFELLTECKDNTETYEDIAKIFNLCDVPKTGDEVQSLLYQLNSAFSFIAVVDYPYPTSFIEPMPAWPVNYACDQATAASVAHEGDKYAALYEIEAAAAVYYNYEGQLKCLDVNTQESGGISQSGWNVIACNEIAMPFGSSVDKSMFPAYDWDPETTSYYCDQNYGLKPQFDWPFTHFGGFNPQKDFMTATNIVFSNGDLDPWHAGGVLEDVSEGTTVLYIENSAHHLDLRTPNPADPDSVVEARQIETELIASWIDQYQGTEFLSLVQRKGAEFLQ